MYSSSLADTKWKCQYHIVFIRKYRKKVLYGRVRDDVREVIRTLCRYKNVEIIEGAVCINHIHLYLSIPPKIGISEFMGYLKVKSALMIYDRHPELGNKWDRSFLARGYYISTIENVDENTIRKYTKEQEEELCKESRAQIASSRDSTVFGGRRHNLLAFVLFAGFLHSRHFMHDLVGHFHRADKQQHIKNRFFHIKMV